MNRRSIFSDRYNNLFFAGIIVVLVTFLSVRPLNSPWHPFIAGDGLGYYAYLPAKFIHNDPNLDFKWFARVYRQNYVYDAFDNPEDNLLVAYRGKKINKYYQGLSYIWMPFFIAAHLCAKIFHYVPDGFSKPYQYFIGLASLFYLLLGLFLLRNLLLAFFKNAWVAATVPFVFFFGTHLFTYAIFANTLSHVYSFTFITGFIYFSHRFFQLPEKKLRSFLWAALFFTVSACIRPLNGLAVLLLPGLIPAGFFRSRIIFEKPGLQHLMLICLAGGCLFYQLWLTHIQTGSFVAYTYTDEKFNFGSSKFIDALFSYHMGLFVYVPVIFLSLFGVKFMNRRSAIVFCIVFFLVIFLYSSWWYWPITKRALVDYYSIPAVFLGALLANTRRKIPQAILAVVVVLSALYFQFKSFQVRNGMLDENLTYRAVFWRNFFSTDKSNMFLVPPQTIIAEEAHHEGFEGAGTSCKITGQTVHSGSHALLLDSSGYICTVAEAPLPSLYKREGMRKVKLSFQLFAETSVNSVHVFVNLTDSAGKTVLEVPFYINEDFIHPQRWDYKEFGCDLPGGDYLDANKVTKCTVKVWNVEAKRNVFIDDVALTFILTDRSFETVK